MTVTSSDAEENGKFFLIDACADDAKSADDVGGAGAHVPFAGNIIEVEPSAVLCGEDALCTQDDAVGGLINELFQNGIQLLGSVLAGGFYAPAGKHIVGVVVMMVVVVFPTATGAGASFLVIVVVMLVVMVTAAALVFLMMVMLVVVVTAAALAFLMMVVMLVMVVTATVTKW